MEQGQFARKVGANVQDGILSLSVCCLRAEGLRRVLTDEIEQHKESGSYTDTAAFAEHLTAAIREVRATEVSRMWTLLCVFYAALYVVIEGWHELALQDTVVNRLLNSPHVQTLKDFRNAILHPNLFGERRVMTLFGSPPSLHGWTIELTDAFLAYFRAWGASDESRLASWDTTAGA